jgi:rhamnogalacturonyl hydrolase YesR
MKLRSLVALQWLACVLFCIPAAEGATRFDIGLSASGQQIDALAVDATRPAPRTVVLVGGLRGEDAGSAAVRRAVKAYAQRRERPVRLLAIPLTNPDAATLVFPPTGVAYREQTESQVLWRWLGAQAPDLVLIASGDDAGLSLALGTQAVADMGRIPARTWSGDSNWVNKLDRLARSEAHEEQDRRRARSPRQLATELAAHYGRDFDQPWYIGAIALIARAKLGDVADVQRLAEPWVDGRKDSLARPNSLVMAGHIVFTELARRTADPRYIAAVRKVADLGFDAQGQMRESMPYHDQFSDSVFMGTAILAQAGALTGERRYFDMADRHLRFMEGLDLRPDGLYRHEPATDMAWSRGNGFAALGLALVLSELPGDHPGHAHALDSYRKLLDALLPLQTRDGLWRNVVNKPGTFAEFSSTAMIGFAIQRGLSRGWISGRRYREAADRAWLAVNTRSSASGRFIDVCESTARMKSAEDYVHRMAILGEDPRGGAMALLFATERMEAR